MQARMETGTGLAQMLAHSLSQTLRRISVAMVRGWRRVVGDTAYRPEKHYMRGPGPKWRAKHTEMGAPGTGRQAPHDAARNG